MIGLLDKTLGGLLGGTWANSYLFMIEIIMMYQYFSRYKTDHITLKLMVLGILAVDILGVLGDYACVYLYTVTHWGDKEYLSNQYWPIPVYVVTTGISAFVVQHYLIYRYWTVSRNWLISIFLVLESWTTMAGALSTAIIIVTKSSISERGAVLIPATIWLVATAVVDVNITAVLIFEFRNMKTVFKGTQTVLNRLTSLAVKTGTPAAVAATIALIIFLNDKSSNISVAFAFCLGRIYAITLLYNLNVRSYGKGSSDNNNSYPSNPDQSRHIPLPMRGNHNESRMDGIHVQVHKTAVVQMDDQKIGDADSMDKV
ncbi:hypothetical protein VNI00_014119 [Paramarasmius palmivorus]|uniref:DUF6534 domain-containing protein n=1 Tax=Paramarasmius palmivorus TaxID=297713 RepID=A0AAW0BUA8_9AGAR